MERHLDYFEAQDYRALGFTLTQLTDAATSLHARELYRIEFAPAAPPAPAPVSRVIAVPAGTWEAVFTEVGDPARNERFCLGDGPWGRGRIAGE